MAPKAQVQPTYEVDKKGLAKQLARKGKAFAVIELIQNAWDEDTKNVHVTLEKQDGGSGPGGVPYKLTVEDDNPEGFADLAHAYTLFAESAKKSDPTKRGRFNLGEKLVIAVCETASIATTKGTVIFTDAGRTHSKAKRKSGTVFTGILRMTKDEVAEVEAVVHTLLPPHGIATTFNFVAVAERKPLTTFKATLRTERSDEDGNLKPTTRKTTVEVYEPLDGEQASIYEMGIPVVETGDRYHVNVMQKIPLNMDRDNVAPSYLRDVRTLVLNNTHDLLSAEDMKAAWVTNAMEDENVEAEAVKAAVVGKFGENSVVYDPTDPEANKIAAEQGYTVIPGGALPKGAWANVKANATVAPAGQVTPSPKPHADGAELGLMDPDHYTADIERVVLWTKDVAMQLTGADITVRVANANKEPFAAMYGPLRAGRGGAFTYNAGRLGFKWFRAANAEAQVDLIIHELGHHFCSDHLDRRYLNALTLLGARATMLALAMPDFFAELTCEGVAV